MVDKVKVDVDAELLKDFGAAHKDAAKLTSEKALLANVAEHGAKTSKVGVYAYLASVAWQHGLLAAKANKEPNFGPVYDAWFLANMGRERKAAEDERKGDRSAFGAWAAAAADGRAWVKEWADKAFALANVPIARRAAVVRKLLELKAAPTAEEWEEMRPTAQSGGQGGSTITSKASAFLRSAEAMLDVDPSQWKTPGLFEEYSELLEQIKAFEAKVKAQPKDTKAGTRNAKAEEKAAIRAANLAKLRAKAEPIKLDS